MATAVFLTTDLMFGSRVLGAARALAVPLEMVASAAALPSKLTADCRLVILDLTLDHLNLPAVVSAVRAAAPSAHVVAYGPHVDQALLADASVAGCNQVLSRGQFDKLYRDLLAAAK